MSMRWPDGLGADGTTMVTVTHDLAFAAAVSTRVLFLDGGRVVEDGPTGEVFEHPRHEATRRFIRNLKVLEIEVLDPGFDYVGASTDIAAYCARNLVPHRLAHRLQLAFEELMQQVLAGRLGSGAQRFRAEYSPADERVYVTATYRGDTIEWEALPDDLSLRLLSGLGADLAFADRGDTHSVTLSL